MRADQVVLTALSTVGTYASPGATPTATVDSGVVVGTQTSFPGSPNLVNRYLGIPFAAPPVRFSPAVRPDPWNEPLHATAYGPACVQRFPYPEATRNITMAIFNPGSPDESEDCLTVNVFAPADCAGAPKAVMVWIYGGDLEFGSTTLDVYDGTSLAANHDVVLVSLNYRTNVFGFPGAPQLPLTETNLGFLDQRLALDWVQRNIAAFGGDPDQVTIFGESAGAASVDGLVLTTPESPPFRAAIMESGQMSFYANPPNPAASWNTLLDELACTSDHDADVLACVRAADALTIKSIIEHAALDFGPVVDDVTLPSNPVERRQAGDIARVPVLLGTNRNEATLFVATLTDTTAFLEATFPGQTELQQAILDAYPLGAEGIDTTFDQIGAIYTDFVFQCPAARLANNSVHAGLSTHRYFLNATFPNLTIPPSLFPLDAGVYHTYEIPLVFGSYPQEDATRAEVTVSALLQGIWADFARDPSNFQGFLGKRWPHADAGIYEFGQRDQRRRESHILRPGTLDARCVLYADVYDALGNA